MALTLTHIPEFVQAIGPSQYVRGYNLAPGVSDYPAGGYPITAASVGLTYLFGAYIVTQNAASQIFLAQFQFTTGFSNTNPQPQATIYLKVLEVNTSSGAYYQFGEVATNSNLTGFAYWACFIGY